MRTLAMLICSLLLLLSGCTLHYDWEDSNKCYYLAFENFRKYGGELVSGYCPRGEHAWIEVNGQLIDNWGVGNCTYYGIPSNYKSGLRTDNPQLWLKACAIWDNGGSIYAINSVWYDQDDNRLN